MGAGQKIIVNQTFVKRYFAGRNPIGRHVGFGMDPGTKTDMEIIGVVKDIKYTNLRDEIPEQAYVPYLASRYVTGMTVYLRTGSRSRPIVCRCARQSTRAGSQPPGLLHAHHRGAD